MVQLIKVYRRRANSKRCLGPRGYANRDIMTFGPCEYTFQDSIACWQLCAKKGKVSLAAKECKSNLELLI